MSESAEYLIKNAKTLPTADFHKQFDALLESLVKTIPGHVSPKVRDMVWTAQSSDTLPMEACVLLTVRKILRAGVMVQRSLLPHWPAFAERYY